MKVSFQGEHGAYSEAAACKFIDGMVQAFPHPTFADALQDVIEQNTGCAVLPVENSIEGSVGESYDLLYETPLHVTGEIYYRIEHCLIGRGRLDEIDAVYSHPQALGQCRRFITEHGIKTIPAYDTAGSVRIIKDMDKDNCACIASMQASEIYGMPVIAQGIADNADNYTRFLVLSRGSTKPTGQDKTSLIFSIKHEPGSLYRIISRFEKNRINLTKIESRPTRQSAWEYNFYVDFEGHKDSADIARIIRGIGDDAISVKVLGSYPAAV